MGFPDTYIIKTHTFLFLLNEFASSHTGRANEQRRTYQSDWRSKLETTCVRDLSEPRSSEMHRTDFKNETCTWKDEVKCNVAVPHRRVLRLFSSWIVGASHLQYIRFLVFKKEIIVWEVRINCANIPSSLWVLLSF